MKLTGPTRFADKDGTWYSLDDVPVPRVSSILDGITSPELERYKRRQLYAGFEAGRTYSEALAHSERTLEALAQRGTAIHTLIELGEGLKLNEVKAAAAAVIQMFGGQTAAVEQTIVRLDDEGWPMYAGTLDLKAFTVEHGELCIADWKSGSVGARPYLRHLLQITAYSMATHYANGDGELVGIDREDWPTKGAIIGLEQDGGFTGHLVDLSPTSSGAEQLRQAVDACVVLWKMRQMYGTGSGFAATMKGRHQEW